MSRLPSYASTSYPATRHELLQDVLRIVIPRLGPGDLFRVAQVSKAFSAIALSKLWSNPVEDFSAHREERTLQDANSLYWHCINHVQPSSAAKVRILDFSDSIWDGQDAPAVGLADQATQAKYFSQLNVLALPHCPKLVDGLDLQLESFNLYVLAATGCASTAPYRQLLLSSHAHLLYLDLSELDSGFGDFIAAFLKEPEGFRGLAALKLRDVRGGLTTVQVGTMFKRLKARLFSLDLSDNRLKDDCLEWIEYYLPPKIPVEELDPSRRLEKLFPKSPSFLADSLDEHGTQWVDYLQSPPVYTKERLWESNGEAVDRESNQDPEYESVAYRDDTLQGVIRLLSRQGCFDQGQSQSFTEWLRTEPDAINNSYATNTVLSANTGITHLHIGGNPLSAKTLIEILSNRGMQLLDFGSYRNSPHIVPTKALKDISQHLPFLRTQLRHRHFHRLEHLRIHHSFVTFNLTEPFSTQSPPHTFTTCRPNPDPFNPHHLPSLHTLILTQVPQKVSPSFFTSIKTTLIAATKQEDFVSTARKLIRSTPRWGTPLFSGLRVLRLEMEIRMSGNDGRNGEWTVDVDADVEALNAAAEDDFSFFAEETKEDRQEGKKEAEWRDQRVDLCDEIRTFRKSDVRRWSGVVEIVYGPSGRR